MQKHPSSLVIFFTTEMWERYGFYVVQSLLALYLALHFNWPDEKTYALVGSFTALTYLSPLVGGWIADKLIGQRTAILTGAIVLFISYCLLSFGDNPQLLAASLAGIAVGTGLLKPNISSLLGHEYHDNGAYRESGFTLFYMGITVGIILGTTLPSLLSHRLSWTAAFISAACSMILAFAIFLYGIFHFKIKDYNHFIFKPKNIISALGLMLFLWSFAFYILNSPQLAGVVFAGVVLVSALYLAYAVFQEQRLQSRQTLVIGLLCLISVMFWSFYFQMFLSLTLFITRVVQPTFCGINFPAPYYVTIQSLGMLAIGHFLARKAHPNNLLAYGLSTGKKFLTAMLLMTAAYGVIVLVLAIDGGDTNSLLSPLAIIPAYLFISLAELLLSPVGLAAITVLADKDKVSTFMGIFFVSLGIGGFLAGKLATLAAIPAGETNVLQLKNLYSSAFIHQLQILCIASVACLALFILIKLLLQREANRR